MNKAKITFWAMAFLGVLNLLSTAAHAYSGQWAFVALSAFMVAWCIWWCLRISRLYHRNKENNYV